MTLRSSVRSRPTAAQSLRAGLAILAVPGVMALTGCQPADNAEGEPDVVTEVSVQVTNIVRTTLRQHIEAYGSVEPEPAGGGRPAGAARLAAPLAGVVLAVPAREGEHVEAGAVIVKLDDRLAISNLAFAEQQFERQKKLWTVEGTSEKVFQEAARQLAAARAQLVMVQLTAPMPGIVARINVHPGQAVDLNTVVAEIVDPDRLVVTVNVPAGEIGPLKVGQSAEFFTGSAGKLVGTGKVSFISPQFDPKTGTALVRMTIAAGSGLRSGQLLRTRIASVEHTGRLAVPIESVVTDADGNSVIALVKGDTAIRRPVTTGVSDGGLIEIEGEGFREGDTVVTVGAYGLPKQTKVKLIRP